MSDKASELGKAADDLQKLLNGRLDDGGYPAVISIEIKGYIVVADVDHDDAPKLTIIKNADFLALWRRANRAVVAGDFEDIVEALFECDDKRIL